MADRVDFHFVNADNKQTVPRIMGIYRELGVPCAGIVDFDVLNESTEFDAQLLAIAPTGYDLSLVQTARKTIAQDIGETDPSTKVSSIRSGLAEIQKFIDGNRVRWMRHESLSGLRE